MGLSTLVLVAGVAAVSGARVHPAARQASRAASHTMMARSTLIAGNWKMNTVLSEALELAAAVKDASASAPGDVAVCVPFPFIEQVGKVLAGSKVGLGAQVRAPARAPISARARGAAAPPPRPGGRRRSSRRALQDCSESDKGAYTGAVSTGMLKSVGAQYILTGHSERRSIFGESDELINKKTLKVATQGSSSRAAAGTGLGGRGKARRARCRRRRGGCLLLATPLPRAGGVRVEPLAWCAEPFGPRPALGAAPTRPPLAPLTPRPPAAVRRC